MRHTSQPDPIRRRWPAHVLAGVGVIIAFVAGFALYFLSGGYWGDACEASSSEAIVAAPDSPRGRLLCSIDEDGYISLSMPVFWSPVVVLGIGLILTLVRWIRSGRVLTLVLMLLGSALAPLAMTSAVHLLRADCSEEEQRTYGAAGCERNEELRPGIGLYR